MGRHVGGIASRKVLPELIPLCGLGVRVSWSHDGERWMHTQVGWWKTNREVDDVGLKRQTE